MIPTIQCSSSRRGFSLRPDSATPHQRPPCASRTTMTSDYRPTRVGEKFFLQIGTRWAKVLMRVTEIDDAGNFKSTSVGVDEALTVKHPVPTFVYMSQK